MTIVEKAAELARPSLEAFGAVLTVLPGGRQAVIMSKDQLLAHVGMLSEDVEIVKYRDYWETARAASTEELASQMVVSAVAA